MSPLSGKPGPVCISFYIKHDAVAIKMNQDKTASQQCVHI